MFGDDITIALADAFKPVPEMCVYAPIVIRAVSLLV
jgi:hypothetical protein